MRHRGVLVLSVAALCTGLLADSQALQADQKTGTLDIYFIDVEGGAANLLVTPEGESLLIDSGYPDNQGRDLNRIVKVAKDVAGLSRIDHAMVSHWHLDHFGNHAALAAIDKNGDGELSEEEIDGAIIALKTLDRNRDRRLDA
ncbi:hypothetical protein E3A20_28830, partial [Planctomyces bekefii]